MAIRPFTLHGERIHLVPVAPGDAVDVARIVQDPEIPRWTTITLPYSLEDARQWTSAAAREWATGSPHWAIRLSEDNTFVGALTLFRAGTACWEVGFWLSAEYRGHGLTSEAVRLSTIAAFEELGAHRVQWKAIVGNWASWKAVWRTGFRREGIQRGLSDSTGEAVDHWTAAILRGDQMTPATPWDGPGMAGIADAPALDPSQPGLLVGQFHSVYSMPDRLRDHEPPTLEDARIGLRMDLIAEEFCELVGAVDGPAARTEAEAGISRAVAADDRTRDLVETADALADLVYVIYGMARESGIDLDAVLAEVQASNLSKLMPDGSVRLREDGKVLKGPDYFRPNVRRALGLPEDPTG